ncbi:tetratricopeptide repeat protein [Halalkalibacter akibai]|uniref:TPR repeat protein n=1 Tax=Halalkalibacter akibai (strain ATCC 43226 / DSM 21942 / CIP 109018 / JCM 9157 / 1139) TaxID=1236973 RepID=W4QTD0_HALA3|nr:tetratricopeptide repeat protein [Halalkalibacter akibai]GAE34569.1 TPR repeat protein [Halalkalibacter akibai JCM 9157]
MNAIEKVMQGIEQGHVEKGLTELASLEKTGDHQLKYDIAEAYYQLGHIDKAKNLVDELLMLYPDEGSLYAFAAELLIDLDEEDEAIELLLEIKEHDPAYLQAQLLLADLYQLQSLDEVAEQKLLKAAEKAPNEPIISYGLGEFYLGRGDYIKAFLI